MSRELKKFIRAFYKLRKEAEVLGLVQVQGYFDGAVRGLSEDICTFKRREFMAENRLSPTGEKGAEK